MLKKGEVFEATIGGTAFQAGAVARVEGLAVFLPYAVPGERVRARVIRRRRKHAEAIVEEILEASPSRVPPRCRYFGICGGCTWQHVAYPAQLEFKRQQVQDVFQRIGGFRQISVCPTLPSPDPYYYRNKMEFSFGTNRWLLPEEIESGAELRKGFALGLHIPGRYDKVLDLEVCYLQDPLTVQIVNRVRELALQRGWSAYDVRTHQGYLRHLVLRCGTRTGQWMVNLVTSRSEPDRMKELSEILRGEFPQVTTFLNSIYSGVAGIAAGEEQIVYLGDGTIRDRIGSLTFQITASSFFQPNTRQAEQLFQVIQDLAALQGRETVYDLYSGIGAIALTLAGRAQKVIGIESQEESVKIAAWNALENGIANASFYKADVRDVLTPAFARGNGSPDLLVVDPPRAGMHKDVPPRILELQPSRIVYVSCNPATQARDVKLLSSGYRLETIQPVDMFPQTYHIENVVLLVAK